MSQKPTQFKEITKQFSEKGDAHLAHRLQNEEFNKKYEWNRNDRKIARTDVPVAKQVYNEEEVNLQKERFDYIQKMNKLRDEDEELARKIQEKDILLMKKNELYDQQIAISLNNKEMFDSLSLRPNSEYERKKIDKIISLPVDPNDDIEYIQMQNKIFQDKEILKAEKDKIQQEINDKKLAYKLYIKEISQSPKEVTYSLNQPRMRKSGINNSERLADQVFSFKDFDGFEIPEGMSHKDQQEIIRLQDEELARALQESESIKAQKRKVKNLVNLEKNDEEFARFLQETENLNIDSNRSISLPLDQFQLRSYDTNRHPTNDSSISSNLMNTQIKNSDFFRSLSENHANEKKVSEKEGLNCETGLERSYTDSMPPNINFLENTSDYYNVVNDESNLYENLDELEKNMSSDGQISKWITR